MESAFFGWCTNYLIDVKHAVIMDVAATPAHRTAETEATQRMIDTSLPISKRNKAFIVHDRLATGNPAFVSTVVNLMPTLPGSQDLLEACMTQVSLENNNRNK